MTDPTKRLEARARKLWHDWYNGEEPRGPGDLYIGSALVDEEDVVSLTRAFVEVRVETLREVAMLLAEHGEFLASANFVKGMIPARTPNPSPKYPPDTEYE